MTPEICNHVNVSRYEHVTSGPGVIWHCICEDCFEEWVE